MTDHQLAPDLNPSQMMTDKLQPGPALQVQPSVTVEVTGRCPERENSPIQAPARLDFLLFAYHPSHNRLKLSDSLLEIKPSDERQFAPHQFLGPLE